MRFCPECGTATLIEKEPGYYCLKCKIEYTKEGVEVENE